ncbi:hypothetical protein BS78_02G239300 [Paspalum vaginatum]|nr:hypothetical protein BS78_02G239300 [Paspalum vaginatum]
MYHPMDGHGVRSRTSAPAAPVPGEERMACGVRVLDSSALSVTKAVAQVPAPELSWASARSYGETPNTSSLQGARAAASERCSASFLAASALSRAPMTWRQQPVPRRRG